MIRAVIDANVLASAFIRPKGPSGQILRRFLERGEFELVLSRPILDELGRVLFYPRLRKELAVSDDEIRARVANLGVLAVLAEGEVGGRIVEADPDDDKYVAAALHGQAPFLVSGDRHLLDLKDARGVRILKPREFLEVLSSQRPT
ncbi:MAG: putative toxin-antitoxin system toxin component, PIN family [Planctomycetia bacterium]|nr:putative toxin-antitoxin system toxin component, PIN family [Planctomycetia bacterium]